MRLLVTAAAVVTMLAACGDDGGGSGAAPDPSQPGTAVIVFDGEGHEASAACETGATDVLLTAADVTVEVTFAEGDTRTLITVETSDGEVVESDPDSIELEQSGPVDALVGRLSAEVGDGEEVSANWACPAG
jgi:hypothetical protein